MGSQSLRDFYPRPPRGGRRVFSRNKGLGGVFLSTPSARRATGGRKRGRNVRLISIHALREEGDMTAQPSETATPIFLSTPSARRATTSEGERPRSEA